jgi:hypothetical protein
VFLTLYFGEIMKTIVLISCSKEKSETKQPAELLYQPSALFSKSLRYAREIVQADEIFILSALHGLVGLKQELEPYNVTLKGAKKAAKREWSVPVLQSIKEKTDIEKDQFVLLAGNDYIEFLEPHFKHCQVPMRGLRSGERLQWLNEKLGIGKK